MTVGDRAQGCAEVPVNTPPGRAVRWLAVALAQWHDGLRVEACFPGTAKRGEWRLSQTSLDAAVKAAMLGFADHDVFLPARAP